MRPSYPGDRQIADPQFLAYSLVAILSFRLIFLLAPPAALTAPSICAGRHSSTFAPANAPAAPTAPSPLMQRLPTLILHAISHRVRVIHALSSSGFFQYR